MRTRCQSACWRGSPPKAGKALGDSSRHRAEDADQVRSDRLRGQPSSGLHTRSTRGREPRESTDRPEAVLLFANDSAELTAEARPFLAAALRDTLAYVAYPKAGKLGTDLNRDILGHRLGEQGIRPARQISLDDDWSTMRLRLK